MRNPISYAEAKARYRCVEETGVLRTEEVYRLPNSVQRVDGHLEWDIDSLFTNVKQVIREAFAKYPVIESLSIDTWAVDYVLLKDQ